MVGGHWAFQGQDPFVRQWTVVVIPSGTCSLPCRCFVIRPCSYNVQKPYAGGYHRSANVQRVPNTGKTAFKRRDLAGVGNLYTPVLEYFREEKKKKYWRDLAVFFVFFCWLSVLIRSPPRLCFTYAFGCPLQEWSLPHQSASPWSESSRWQPSLSYVWPLSMFSLHGRPFVPFVRHGLLHNAVH